MHADRPVIRRFAVFRFETIVGGLELVFVDLPVQGAAADVEHAGGFLLVPADRVEHPQDVSALGLAQRRQPVAARRRA